MNQPTFEGFPKIPRLSRNMVITEKIDGTNAQIYIPEPGTDDWAYCGDKNFPFMVGSRNRWIWPDQDNYGFARWAYENQEMLLRLGYGHHYGEWWGQGIQRGYGLTEKRFSLFNVHRWREGLPEGVPVSLVPVLRQWTFDTEVIRFALNDLVENGSVAAPGFMKPEGIVIYHTASGQIFKKTIENDEKPKGVSE